MIYNITYSPRFTRMVKSYAPIKNGLTEALGISGPDNQPIRKFCKEKRKYYNSDEFYVNEGLQHKDPRTLSSKNFRGVCKEIWDQRVRNQKKGLGWKSDDKIFNPGATLESFFEV